MKHVFFFFFLSGMLDCLAVVTGFQRTLELGNRRHRFLGPFEISAGHEHFPTYLATKCDMIKTCCLLWKRCTF